MSGAKRQILRESLIVLGEIGGNDYNFWLNDPTRPREVAAQFIPDVVRTIGSSAQVPYYPYCSNLVIVVVVQIHP